MKQNICHGFFSISTIDNKSQSRENSLIKIYRELASNFHCPIAADDIDNDDDDDDDCDCDDDCVDDDATTAGAATVVVTVVVGTALSRHTMRCRASPNSTIVCAAHSACSRLAAAATSVALCRCLATLSSRASCASVASASIDATRRFTTSLLLTLLLLPTMMRVA